MRVAVFGSTDWDKYPDLMRELTVLIQESAEMGHEGITFVHQGKNGAENMITEYVGKTEKFLREKNFKLKEELFRSRIKINQDLKILESGIDFAMVFSTKDKRTASCEQLLSVYNIPTRVIE